MSVIAAGLGTGAAQAQSACETYTIRSGDSLAAIAKRAYGDSNQYLAIFDANRSVIGSNPDLITVGMALQLPCSDGSAPAATMAAAAEASAGSVTGAFDSVMDASILQAASAPASTPVAPPSGDFSPFVEPIRFVTAGNYSPFTGPELPEGGMYTELVRTAIARSDDTRPIVVDFVDAWSVHLGELLPQGQYDMGFPWYLPDCTNLEPLNPSDRSRCTDYDHSDPFYEVVIGMYVLADNPLLNARTPEDAYGTTICRPAGYFQFDLAQAGLAANATIVTPDTPNECLELVMNGEADIYTINQLTGEDTISDMGLEGQVVELAALTTVQRLHVLTPKNNPLGKAEIAALNQGLRRMVESGEWFLIVSRHLMMVQ